ncbi:immunity 49 family protein [Streptomyces sp. NPDC047971]|uniref:immunity 49 family protein n=1 Tax=Streptomyces sp. NPDC047971 TaxID=3154499 RepID=UPI0033C9044E
MREVTRHEVDEQRIVQALEDIGRRAFGRWHGLRYDRLSLTSLAAMGHELLDHVAASTLEDPGLGSARTRTALRTSAACAFGVLDLGSFPDGDWEISFPLLNETLSSDEFSLGHAVDQAPTARTWLDAFALCVVSGAVWERERVFGLLLREDYAPAIRDGVPYSPLDSRSEPADLAEMDALCGYLTPSRGHLPRDWPSVTLCLPDAEERAEAARRLDGAGPLSPDQRLLRVLLENDRPAFEEALAGRLVRYRESAPADAEPRSLLPVGTIALAALAVQAHGWEPGVSSGYLPEGLLRVPEGAPGVGV